MRSDKRGMPLRLNRPAGAIIAWQRLFRETSTRSLLLRVYVLLLGVHLAHPRLLGPLTTHYTALQCARRDTQHITDRLRQGPNSSAGARTRRSTDRGKEGGRGLVFVWKGLEGGWKRLLSVKLGKAD